MTETLAEIPTRADAPTLTRVSVVDINMPFTSMVGFMVKWVLAAIPALLILAVFSAVIAGVFTAVIASLR